MSRIEERVMNIKVQYAKADKKTRIRVGLYMAPICQKNKNKVL